MRHVWIILLSVSALAADREISVLTVAQFTKPSTGYGYGLPQRQTASTGLGEAFEYRQLWGSNGFSVSYAGVRSDAKFSNAYGGSIQFGLKRHEFAVDYVHRWQHLYLKAGGGVFLTNGGWAPGGVVGLDHQQFVQGEVGTDWHFRHGLALRTGLAVNWFRAPNFADVGYKGGHTFMLEPKIGISWTLPQFGGK